MEKKAWTLEECLDQLESCGFNCEAGPLENNIAFMFLKDAVKVVPKYLPGQAVFYNVKAEVAGEELSKWCRFYIVGCRMASCTEKRFFLYDLSNDPPAPYHYGKVNYSGIAGEALRLEDPAA